MLSNHDNLSDRPATRYASVTDPSDSLLRLGDRRYRSCSRPFLRLLRKRNRGKKTVRRTVRAISGAAKPFDWASEAARRNRSPIQCLRFNTARSPQGSRVTYPSIRRGAYAFLSDRFGRGRAYTLSTAADTPILCVFNLGNAARFLGRGNGCRPRVRRVR
jgi:hypothetical protein